MQSASNGHISIIVPVYNAADTLALCLEALRAQVEDGDEIIVVDNNSTDSSREIAENIAGDRVAHCAKQGSYAARNVGCRVATGDALAFIDPDCVPGPGWRQAIEEAFVDQTVSLVIGSRSLGRDSLPLDLVARYEEAKASWVYSQDDPTLFYAYTNNMAVRRSLWEEIGPFVERRRGSDTIFVRRALDRHSPAVARHVPAMNVRHLEIDRLRTYFAKMRSYGRSRGLYQHIVDTRPLSNRERLGVLRRTLGADRPSLVATVVLTCTLAIGLLFWSFGSLTASWARDEGNDC